jgi:hypothetical protein
MNKFKSEKVFVLFYVWISLSFGSSGSLVSVICMIFC